MKTAIEIKCCKYGHELTSLNTYIDSKGHRSCNQCRLDRSKRQYEQVKEQRSLERRAAHLFSKYSMEDILKLAAVHEAMTARVASKK